MLQILVEEYLLIFFLCFLSALFIVSTPAIAVEEFSNPI
jgi:hypothetical protein